MANCGRVGICGGGHIITICWRVVRIGHRIPVSPVITSSVANVLNRGDLNVRIAYS